MSDLHVLFNLSTCAVKIVTVQRGADEDSENFDVGCQY